MGCPARDAPANGLWLKSLFGERLWLAVHLHRGCDDARRLQQLHVLAGQVGIRAVACGDVHMHVRGRRALQDCMTAIRQHCTLAEAGRYLYPNGERHLRTLTELGELYPPDLLAETQVIAHRCRFGLDELKYQYPSEVVPQGHTPPAGCAICASRACPNAGRKVSAARRWTPWTKSYD